jgi:glycine cleavage system H lipoate-binding protein
MGDNYVDLFATKGLEYILVIAFLATLVVFWRFLNRQRGPAPTNPVRRPRVEWFTLGDNLYYHQGHSWAKPEGANAVRVGIDDFAQKLVGKIDSVVLPPIGTRLSQGDVGWKFRVGSKLIELLSPVEGEVVAINEEATMSPELLNRDPYGRGWLVLVKISSLKSNLRNLLSGALAGAWMEQTVEQLRRRMSGNLGVVLQDGGVPVEGIAKSLSRDQWDEVVREFLLTK